MRKLLDPGCLYVHPQEPYARQQREAGGLFPVEIPLQRRPVFRLCQPISGSDTGPGAGKMSRNKRHERKPGPRSRPATCRKAAGMLLLGLLGVFCPPGGPLLEARDKARVVQPAADSRALRELQGQDDARTEFYRNGADRVAVVSIVHFLDGAPAADALEFYRESHTRVIFALNGKIVYRERREPDGTVSCTTYDPPYCDQPRWREEAVRRIDLTIRQGEERKRWEEKRNRTGPGMRRAREQEAKARVEDPCYGVRELLQANQLEEIAVTTQGRGDDHYYGNWWTYPICRSDPDGLFKMQAATLRRALDRICRRDSGKAFLAAWVKKIVIRENRCGKGIRYDHTTKTLTLGCKDSYSRRQDYRQVVSTRAILVTIGSKGEQNVSKAAR